MTANSTSENTALVATAQQFDLAAPMNAASLILGPAFDRVQAFSQLMCKGAVTVPQHLRGNPGDCMAVTLAALSRKMDPFAFAQKTHITKSGALGYEAQLIKAMITTSGAVEGQPEYEFLGDWSRVLGKVEEKQSEKSGGKYYVAKYTKADEEGLGVKIRWTLRGESKPREMTLMLSQCYPRFSTQWATDPQQQICYVADRKFARRYCPETILGVYDIDELDEPAEPKFMGPADVVGATTEKTVTHYPQDKFEENLSQWTQVLASGRKTHDQLIAFIETKGMPLTDAQKTRLRAMPVGNGGKTPASKQSQQVQDVTPKGTPSATEIGAQILAAKDQEELATAGSLIATVEDAAVRQELTELYDKRGNELPPF